MCNKLLWEHAFGKAIVGKCATNHDGNRCLGKSYCKNMSNNHCGNRCFGNSTLISSSGGLRASWGPCGAPLGASWDPLGAVEAIWAHLWIILGAPRVAWGSFGGFRDLLGQSGALLGAAREPLGGQMPVGERYRQCKQRKIESGGRNTRTNRKPIGI
jgi:hypothetical protein